jgi:hypothetical protein
LDTETPTPWQLQPIVVVHTARCSHVDYGMTITNFTGRLAHALLHVCTHTCVLQVTASVFPHDEWEDLDLDCGQLHMILFAPMATDVVID